MNNQPERKKISIGKFLLDQNIINQEQLDEAINEQKISGKKIGQIFIEKNLISESQLLTLLSEQLGIPVVDLKNYPLDSQTVKLLPEFYARRFRAIILQDEGANFFVGMVDPLALTAVDELEKILKKPVRTAFISEGDLLKAIDMMYRKTHEIFSLAGELSEELKEKNYDVENLLRGSLSVQDAPVIKLLKTMLEDAVQVNASDVHIEPDEKVLRIRQRVDGILHEQIVSEKHIAQALTLRLKLMAGLNISEKRLPQDGRFSIKIKDMNFDMRVSTIPVQYGESVVMRLLNQSSEFVQLSQVDMPENILSKLRLLMREPNGLIIVTGPTGSGKTTTLYGMLKELNNPQLKIITVEDPVEYRIERINQIQTNVAIGLTFARALRAILRQDPDVVMIGELRDIKTVKIAIRAAMTGHLVLSTLHTNDAKSSAVRLIDMGSKGYLIATVLRAILAQRLVRRICENCKRDYTLTQLDKNWLDGVAELDYSNIHFKIGAGCTYCYHTGYKGRIGVYELLEITSDLASALRKNKTDEFVKLVNENKNFQTLLRSGLKLATQGVTTLSEIIGMVGENLAE